jgi:catechol 2,3-dioxygenase-like lactoylglutathione lyase family enzyme
MKPKSGVLSLSSNAASEPAAIAVPAVAAAMRKTPPCRPSSRPHGEGSRWVEVAPPGSAIAIALVPPSEGGTPGGDKTHCALSTDDIEADHATLRARGVEVDAEVAREGRARHLLFDTDRDMGNATVPPMFFFRDIDGNRFLIVEAG